MRTDPTRTTMLRRKFIGEMNRRFRQLAAAIRKKVGEQDAFGLKSTLNTEWRAMRTQEQLDAFREWLQGQVDQTVLAGGNSRAWLREYIDAAYEKGQGRAFDDVMKKYKYGSGASPDHYAGGREQFLRDAFRRPASVERVGVLASRTWSDLRGVTEAMSTQMQRTLVDSFIQGDHPFVMARKLTADVDKIGINRARTIARTETIRAHAEGQLEGLEILGVEEVGVMVEWATAGDDLVCPLCLPMNGSILKIGEAKGVIPMHPNCRCAWIPANVGESTKGQVRGKKNVEAKIKESTEKGQSPLTGKTLDKGARPKPRVTPDGQKPVVRSIEPSKSKAPATPKTQDTPKAPATPTKQPTTTTPVGQPKPSAVMPGPNDPRISREASENYLKLAEVYEAHADKAVAAMSPEEGNLLATYQWQGDKIINNYLRTGKYSDAMIDTEDLRILLEGIGIDVDSVGMARARQMGEKYFTENALKINELVEKYGVSFGDREFVSRGMYFDSEHSFNGFLSSIEKAEIQGSTIQLDGVVSTSYDREYPLNFTGGTRQKGLVLEIQPKKGLPLQPQDFMENESEIILQHGKQYRVRSIQRQVDYGNGTKVDIIQLEEI